MRVPFLTASLDMRGSRPRKQQQLRVIMLSPDPIHPGGVTRAINTWLEGGLAEHVDIQQIHAAAWDASIPIQILQTARAYIVLTLALLWSRPRPGVVHVHVSTGGSLYREWIAVRLARTFRVAVVSHLHSGNFGNWIAGKPARRWFAYNLFRHSGIVVVSAQHWVGLVNELGAHDVRVVPHGLDEQLVSLLAPVAEYVEASQPSKRAVVLYYGRWAPVKGLDILGEAVRALDVDRRSRLTLRLFGNGNRAWLEQCMDNLDGADVHIGGWLSDEGKAGELSRARAFVSPSRSELFGQALLEVMAAGKPVIATRVGGIPDVLDGYPDARLVTPENPKALQSALEDLLDGVWPDSRRDQPKHLSTRFSARTVAAQIANIYQTAEGSF
jgi:glycosyltransferase involved in cell wall biosynthesis